MKATVDYIFRDETIPMIDMNITIDKADKDETTWPAARFHVSGTWPDNGIPFKHDLTKEEFHTAVTIIEIDD